MPNPQASAPQPAAGAGDNPIKQVLGKVIQQVLYPLSQQNPSIQEDLSNAIRSLVSAIQKADQGASSAPQQPPAPTQQ
jgi:hypothetical protein